MPSKRPFSATLLLWMVLSLLAWGVVRLAASLRAWNVLSEFGSSLSPVYLSITGAGWGATGCVLLFGVLSIRSWVRPAIITSTMLWLLEYWLERIFFQVERTNAGFAIMMTFISIALVAFAAMHPKTKTFFTKSEEHEQPVKNPNSA